MRMKTMCILQPRLHINNAQFHERPNTLQFNLGLFQFHFHVFVSSLISGRCLSVYESFQKERNYTLCCLKFRFCKYTVENCLLFNLAPLSIECPECNNCVRIFCYPDTRTMFAEYVSQTTCLSITYSYTVGCSFPCFCEYFVISIAKNFHTFSDKIPMNVSCLNSIYNIRTVRG